MPPSNFRILHLGNIANYSYRLVEFLRKSGINADLFMNKFSPKQQQPSWEDKIVPEWVHYWKSPFKTLAIFEILQKVKKYDLVHSYYTTVIPLQFSKVPYVFHSMGSDVREVAQQAGLTGILMRRAIKKAKSVICSQADQIPIFKKIGAPIHISYQPIDPLVYMPKKKVKNKGLIIFHPSRLDWRHKGNDKFIRAFSKFANTIDRTAKCICIDTDVDAEKTRNLVNELGLSKNFIFHKLMDKKELIGAYNDADIIVDQFVIGSLGLISLEVLACAKPVITYINKELNSQFYPELPPVLNAQTEEEIYEQLKKAKDASFRKIQGKKSRDWILKYHHWKKVTEDLIELYKKILKV